MAHDLSFSLLLKIAPDETGLVVPVSLLVGEEELALDAYLDTGAKYCVFPRWVGTSLGLEVEAGAEIHLSTGGGLVPAYLHYLTLRVSSLYFEAVPVCFIKFEGFPRCLLGRGGWLQKVRLGLVLPSTTSHWQHAPTAIRLRP
jgi:hypothetical protein